MAETEAATEEPEASKEAYQVSRDVAGTLRRQDPVTGDVELYTSIDGILQAVPKMNWDMAATWSRLPIMRVHLFLDKVSFQRGGIMRSYASKVFSPEGLDLIQAIAWWRKRVKSPAKGFAVFEASFDSQVCITDPPTLMLDGATGEAEADDAEAIQRKRESHAKRRELDKRWVTKGISEEALQKIKQADMHRMSRKATGRFARETFGPIEAQKRETEALSEVPPLETHTCKTSIANRTGLINQAVCLLRAPRIFVWSKTCIFSSTDQMYAAL
ncbi:unnamed protein product [Effrenium voratum]|nr:unnamed protein product [Effrenium voratum]